MISGKNFNAQFECFVYIIMQNGIEDIKAYKDVSGYQSFAHYCFDATWVLAYAINKTLDGEIHMYTCTFQSSIIIGPGILHQGLGLLWGSICTLDYIFDISIVLK